MICSATVSGAGEFRNVKFRWKVSHGKITKGQDTASIEVDTTEVFPATIQARVELVGAWPSSCPRQATGRTATVISGPELFARFGEISFEEEKEYRHRYALELENDPRTQPYILVYAARRAYPHEAMERGKRAKDFLVQNYRIEDNRAVVVEADYRETASVELWLVPQGANAPILTPTISPEQVEILTNKPPKRENKNPLKVRRNKPGH
jgi:hypothetical protein